MNQTDLESARIPSAAEHSTPPATNAIDAEVDIEILKVVPKQFCIEDEKSANWLVRKIMSAREYGAHVKEWSERERRRAQREEMALMYLFGRQLERWTREQVDLLNGRRKTIHLPSGTVGFRHENEKLIVDDEIVVIKWAQQNCPTAIKVSETILKTPLWEHFEGTGELPDGTHLEASREVFRVS